MSSPLTSLENECAALSAFVSDLAVKVERLQARDAELQARAAERISRTIERGAASYDRERDLPKLFRRDAWIGKSDGEIRDMLQRAVSAGSKAIAAGSWHADFNRLTALRIALDGERRS